VAKIEGQMKKKVGMRSGGPEGNWEPKDKKKLEKVLEQELGEKSANMTGIYGLRDFKPAVGGGGGKGDVNQKTFSKICLG